MTEEDTENPLQSELSLIQLQTFQSFHYPPGKQYSSPVMQMKYILELQMAECSRKTFTHIEIESLIFCIYNRSVSEGYVFSLLRIYMFIQEYTCYQVT